MLKNWSLACHDQCSDDKFWWTEKVIFITVKNSTHFLYFAGNLFENLEEDDDDEFNDNETDNKSKKKLSDQEYITPEEVKNHMIKLWEMDVLLLKCLLGSYNGPERRKKVTTPEIFFLDVVAVPPSRFRPVS